MKVTSLPATRTNRAASIDSPPVKPPPPIVPIALPFDMPRPQASVKKVALILAVSARTVRNLCAQGELEYTGRGRGFRVFLDSVAAYQERQAQKTRRAS